MKSKTDADSTVGIPALGPEESASTRISTPASTGGAGTLFEQHVGAYWLAVLLMGAIPPILIDSTISEVSFQTGRLGWKTDDFLIVCKRNAAAPRMLVGQVKRSFTISASDTDCVQTIRGFWEDFKSSDRFSPADDSLVLVTQRGTETLLNSFVGLLDCARVARDGAEFECRLATPGRISQKAIGYCTALQTIIGEYEGNVVSRAGIWPFLRVLHVLSLDLCSSTRMTEAQIKSSLALTVTEGDAVAAAAVSWNELVSEASNAIAQGRSLRRCNLPTALQARYAGISGFAQRVLCALKEHTAPIFLNIRSIIGTNLHLQRAALAQEVRDALTDVQVVLIAGPSGSGKSGIGKDVVANLSQDHVTLGFRAEEFAQPHIDATLQAAQVPANNAQLAAVLAAQDRKLVLVESVERLLEKTTRDAFSDLISLAAADPAIHLILTCRDYSVEQVRVSFLQPAQIRHAIVRVPPLDDAELSETEAAYPALTIPLGNPALRNILRNPFYLDKALRITWSAGNPVPESEREFRKLFWCEIVRGGRLSPAEMTRREKALGTIAVRRARALSDFVRCDDLDPVIIESLRQDSLIASPDESPSLVATAHDVLEDWAILHWFEDQQLSEAPFKDLSIAIGASPALRRSYRKWVAELLNSNALAADRLFQAALSSNDISEHFRDDTLVSLLKAPSAPEFVNRHEEQLLANHGAILRRVVHLLRVACVKTSEWFAGPMQHGSIINVPDGPAWPAVTRLVQRNLAGFTSKDRPLLLGLVEDAVSDVSWSAPNIDGAESIAGIAHWLLDDITGHYGNEEPLKRVLAVIAKIPRADPTRFENALRGQIEEGRLRDPVAETLQELIYAGIEGMAAARDLPDLILAVGAERLLASIEDATDERGSSRPPLDIGLYFGIKEELLESFPASALRGPWRHLLNLHTAKALNFYIRVFNQSADWYAHPRLPDRLEPPWEVQLTFADGTTRKQWANPRLWCLYRGMSVGPAPLESMLMALEKWLLDIGENIPERLDAILVVLLRRSKCAALAAVAASAATAYPHASGEALLVLLSVRDYVEMDRSRMVGELQMSPASGSLPTLRADHQIYEDERKTANALAHRRHDLEAAIRNLQLGPLATRVQALLEMHLAALPPKEQQQEHDRIWRLAIHRMDFRQYAPSKVLGPESPDAAAKPGEPPSGYVRLDPKPLDDDLQPMVDAAATRFATLNTRLGVLVWGRAAFRREEGQCDPLHWLSKLSEAQAMDRETDNQDGSNYGPAFVAAVCIRDHWDDLAAEQRDWCIEVVCSEVLRHANDADQMARTQRNPVAGDRPAARVLASLLGKPLAAAQMQRVREAFAVAMTHPVDEVRSYATRSIGEETWATNRPLALRCVNAIAAEATLIDLAEQAEEARPYGQRRQLGEIIRHAAAEARASFWREDAIAADAHVTVDISARFGAYAANRMLAILGRIPRDPLATAAFARASNALASWWKSGDDPNRHHARNYQIELDVSGRLQEFLLRTSPDAAREALAPMLGAIDRHSSELKSLMEGLTAIQDRNPNTAQYWLLWELIAGAAKRARWVPQLGDRSPGGTGLLSALFRTRQSNPGLRARGGDGEVAGWKRSGAGRRSWRWCGRLRRAGSRGRSF
ncbi:MAG TPA: hypothetical protein VMV31_00460, partial [Terriglobales bacterium]|nr:hypothetical protein [Terriglobales bacterium]